jgi:hypothetical protein
MDDKPLEYASGTPTQTDNGPRPEDGPQDVSQDPDVDYSLDEEVPGGDDADR